MQQQYSPGEDDDDDDDDYEYDEDHDDDENDEVDGNDEYDGEKCENYDIVRAAHLLVNGLATILYYS